MTPNEHRRLIDACASDGTFQLLCGLAEYLEVLDQESFRNAIERVAGRLNPPISLDVYEVATPEFIEECVAACRDLVTGSSGPASE